MQVLADVSTQNWILNCLEVMLMWPRTSWWGSIWPQCGAPLEKQKTCFPHQNKCAVTKNWLKIWICWMTFFTGQAEKLQQSPICYMTFIWVFKKAFVSNSVACTMYHDTCWRFSNLSVVIPWSYDFYISPNLSNKAQNDFAP